MHLVVLVHRTVIRTTARATTITTPLVVQRMATTKRAITVHSVIVRRITTRVTKAMHLAVFQIRLLKKATATTEIWIRNHHHHQNPRLDLDHQAAAVTTTRGITVNSVIVHRTTSRPQATAIPLAVRQITARETAIHLDLVHRAATTTARGITSRAQQQQSLWRSVKQQQGQQQSIWIWFIEQQQQQQEE